MLVSGAGVGRAGAVAVKRAASASAAVWSERLRLRIRTGEKSEDSAAEERERLAARAGPALGLRLMGEKSGVPSSEAAVAFGLAGAPAFPFSLALRRLEAATEGFLAGIA